MPLRPSSISVPGDWGRFATEKSILKRLGPVCAVLEIKMYNEFSPKRIDSVPSDVLQGLPLDLAVKFARELNQLLFTHQKNRWSCMAMNAAVFFVRDMPPADRPADPSCVPIGARLELTYDEALEIQNRENFAREHKLLRPDFWTVALRPLMTRSELLGMEVAQ
ncbi:hypothetical protein [Schlesneria paludicola]|uniref:hypothetical protein n=1 Tax=Schlesneria paludicola TaxID=360056 RepID=UPI0012FAB0C7|nr:hypothetical protein [Schlesneria paludicola]